MISIVIVSWNVKDILERCLQSIDETADLPFELFVIDNNSEDSTKVFLKDYKPNNALMSKHEVIYNDKNLGFSKALNKGLSKARGEYVLILNPDTRMIEPSLQKMVNVASSCKNLGVMGFKILNPNGKLQWSISRLPGLRRQLEARLGLWKPKFDYDKLQETEQINASVALIPKKVLDDVGLWDDGFFIWFEENDFCRRARNKGFKIYYSPEISVIHESQAGIKKIPFWKRQFIWQKSMFRYFRKHHGLAQAIAISILDPIFMIIGTLVHKAKRSFTKM